MKKKIPDIKKYNASGHRQQIKKLNSISRNLLILAFALPVAFYGLNRFLFRLENGVYFATGILLLGVVSAVLLQTVISKKMNDHHKNKHRYLPKKME